MSKELPECPVCGKKTVFPSERYLGQLVCSDGGCSFSENYINSKKHKCDFREEAEAHWRFIEKLLKAYTDEENKTTVSMEACHFLYVEAMVHGFKHAKQHQLHEERQQRSKN